MQLGGVDWSEVFAAGVRIFFEQRLEEVSSYFQNLIGWMLDPMVRTPAPSAKGPAGINIAFRSASNAPWDALISDVYFEGIVGLALGLQFILWAIIGLRFGSINPAVRKKLGRRLLIVFLCLFFWLPVASIATQFFDALGQAIVFSGYSEDQVVSTLNSLDLIGDLDTGVLFIVLLVAGYVYLKALFVFVVRWMMTILLTLGMPLVATFWALEVWPFNRFAGLSKQIAGTYPGLLVAGIPPAFLIRISFVSTNWGLVDDFTIFISIITLYLAAKSQKIIITRSSRVSTQIAQQVLASAKKPAKIGGAAAGVAATAGAAAYAGAGGAMAVGGGINAASNAAKGRAGRAAYSAQMAARGLSDARVRTGGTSSQGTPSGTSGQTSAGGQTQSSGPTGPPSPQRATDSSPRSRSAGTGSTDSAGTASGGRLPPNRTAPADSPDDPEGEVTYWDVFGDGVTVEDSSPNSDTPSVPSRVDDTDDDSAAAAPATASDGDPPDDTSAGQTSSKSVDDLFATDDEILGPDHYREP
jgi:hypothetical protein